MELMTPEVDHNGGELIATKKYVEKTPVSI